MRFLSSFLLSVLLLASAPTMAAAPPASGAETLKRVLGEVVHSHAAVLEPTGHTMGWRGEITVETKGDVYTAVIPGVFITSLGGFTLKLGDIRVNAFPGGVAGEKDAWVMSVAFPSTISVIDAAGERVTDIRIGSQRFSGVWVPGLEAFTRLEIEYANLSTDISGTSNYETSIGLVRYQVNMKQDPDGLWSGPRALEVRDFATRATSRGQGVYTLKFGKMAARSAFSGLALADISQAKARRIQRLRDGVEPTGEEAVATLLDEVKSLSRDYAVSLEIGPGEMSFVPDNDVARMPTLRAALGNAAASAAMKGVHGDVGSLSARLGVEKLTFEGLPEPLAGLAPHTVKAQLAVEGMPMKALIGTFSDILKDASAGQADSAASAERMRKMMAGLPEAMKAEGTRLSITDTMLQSRDLGAALDGKIVADPASPVIAVGGLTLTLTGLDEMLAAMREMGANNPVASQYLQGLVPVQLAGKLSKPDNAKSVRTYAFELSPDGAVLLNGTDVSALQGLLSGGQSAPPESAAAP